MGARTIYEPSQMKGHKLSKKCMWPRYKRESRTYPGFHEFRISVQLKVPYDESCEKVEEVMSSGAKRMLNNLTDDFVYVGIEDIVNNNIPIPDICINCL